MPSRVRFAPSPTGYLHIGGVRTALFNWLWAKKTGGSFVLRIEDTDQERSTSESVRIIVDSLRWLGLAWDEGPDVGGAFGPYTQMERLAIYDEHARRLIAGGKAYRCYCTREELEAARAALKARDPKATFHYPGTCRDRKDEPDRPFVVRLRVPEQGVVRYVDRVFGEVTTPNAAQQDYVLLRSDGVPLYNFGAVVDDLTMGITLVARGRDHMVNTPPQILLYEALGHEPPAFAHLPMMLAPSGEKLSKRHGAVSVLEFDTQGFLPEALCNYLLRLGWGHGDTEIVSRDEAIKLFDLGGVGRAASRMDYAKLTHLNAVYLRAADDSRLTAEVLRRLAGRPDLTLDETAKARILALMPGLKDRARTLVELADNAAFLARRPPLTLDAKAQALLTPEARAILAELRATLAETEFSVPAIDAALRGFAESTGRKLGQIAQPLRAALTGTTTSPGIDTTLAALGRDESLARIAAHAP